MMTDEEQEAIGEGELQRILATHPQVKLAILVTLVNEEGGRARLKANISGDGDAQSPEMVAALLHQCADLFGQGMAEQRDEYEARREAAS